MRSILRLLQLHDKTDFPGHVDLYILYLARICTTLNPVTLSLHNLNFNCTIILLLISRRPNYVICWSQVFLKYIIYATIGKYIHKCTYNIFTVLPQGQGHQHFDHVCLVLIWLPCHILSSSLAIFLLDIVYPWNGSPTSRELCSIPTVKHSLKFFT